MSSRSDHPSRPIAYLATEYPALSHTFILREIAALRADGRQVLTASIRRTSGAHVAGDAEAAEAAGTFYVIETMKRPLAVLAALGHVLARPARLAGSIALAWRTRAPGPVALLRQVFYLLEAVILAHHLDRTGAGHLHIHFANSGTTVGMLTARLADIPFSFTLHGPSIFFEPRRQALGHKIAEASFVACISHFCRSQGMIFAAPEDWEKMAIVRCGVEPERYARAPKAEHGAELVFVGRLAAVKGVAVLLEAVARLLPDHPGLRLTLIGNGDERAALEARAGELGVAEAVRFAGARTQGEVAEALSQADLFVLPSFAEGVPVVLMEAMASRLPVVATRIAGIPELVEDGVSGHLVPPGDAEALADAIGGVLHLDAETRAGMGAAGRARVAAEFDIATAARAIARAFDAVAGKEAT